MCVLMFVRLVPSEFEVPGLKSEPRVPEPHTLPFEAKNKQNKQNKQNKHIQSTHNINN